MMKLIDPKTNVVLVEFHKNFIIFHNAYLKEEMKTHGIDIPAYLLHEYHQKERIRYGDQDFCKAFKEVYYPKMLSHYSWKEL